MECNKDEAIRAKLIADNLLKVRDITGAKKFDLKGQDLFSNPEGLSQLLGVVNIHYAHEHAINGEIDYYGILGVDPSADEEIIRKQYKRLALFVHPDKNKLSRAGDAFTILFEAHRVLSNKDERSSYDMKLNLRPPAQTKIFGFTVHATYPRPESAPSQSFSSSNHLRSMPYATFWTGCDRCRIKFEFKKLILDQEIQCAQCQQRFLSVAMPAPSAKKHPVVANMPLSAARTAQAAQGQPSTEHVERGLYCFWWSSHREKERKDDQGKAKLDILKLPKSLFYPSKDR